MTSSISLVPLLRTQFNHVALPPNLPGKQDESIDQVECALIDLLRNASRTLGRLTENDICDQFDVVCHMLDVCKAVNAGGKLDKASLATKFRDLRQKDILILHIAEQNAGLLIRRDQE